MTNREQFISEFGKSYRHLLANDYRYAALRDRIANGHTTFAAIMQSMSEAIDKGTMDHNGLACKATCKKLGIQSTRKAIQDFVRVHSV